MTSTHTHVVQPFANPYLRCDTCGEKVEGAIVLCDQGVGCEHLDRLSPCGHLGLTSICPSWGPVDGCKCKAVFGEVSHPMEPDVKE